MYGGAAILVISFAALRFLWPRPRWEDETPGRDIADLRAPGSRVLGAAGRVLGLGIFLLVLATAAVGENDPADNLAPTTVYITFWVGMAFVSFFVGDVWSAVSPFDTLARPGERRRHADSRRPPDLGYWPAALGLLGFVWLELVYPDRAEPRTLAVAIGAYTLVVVAAGLVWGRRWLRTGEAFTALFGLLARAAPLGRTEDGKLRLVRPSRGWPESTRPPGWKRSCSSCWAPPASTGSRAPSRGSTCRAGPAELPTPWSAPWACCGPSPWSSSSTSAP